MRRHSWALLALLLSTAPVHAQAQAQAPAPPDLAPEGPPQADQADVAPTPPPTMGETVPAPVASAATEADLLDPGELTLSARELEELGFATTTEKTLDTSLHIYGFADFTFSAPLMKTSNEWRNLFNQHPTFWVGNFNVYLSRALSKNFRFMSEVRFTYLPNGGVTGLSNNTVISTAVLDYADFNRVVKWGGIVMERIYLEWSLHRYLTARAGQFLTPYGIWNVDHGTPTYIPPVKPYVIGNQLFPQRQTGLELFGRVEPSAYSVLGYHLTLSNGTGPVSEYLDLDNNKAIGGRLYWQYRKLGDLRIGVSGYYGRETSALPSIGLTPDGQHLATRPVMVAQSDSLALAADVVWRVHGFHLQSEWISQQRRYTDKGRVQSVHPFTGAPIYPIDSFAWGIYFLAGYRFDWYALMPYFEVQTFKQLDPLSSLVTEVVGYNLGINVRPIDEVVIKLAYFEGHFPGGHFVSDSAVRLCQVQLAWAF